MNSFDDIVASWRDRPFPPGSPDDSLDQLHADLALADTWVADSVLPFVKHGLYKPAQVDVIKSLRDLDMRATELGQASDGAGARLAVAYRDYAGLLLQVYEGFLARGSSSV